MLNRCYNQNRKDWENYGGRGIKVCDRWKDVEQGFLNFIEDMGKRPEATSIDRINTNQDYFKGNCRWINKSVQAYNRNIYKNMDNTSIYRGCLGVQRGNG